MLIEDHRGLDCNLARALASFNVREHTHTHCSLSTCRTESTLASLSLVELLHSLDISRNESFEYQLCDAITLGDSKVLRAVVEQHDANVAADMIPPPPLGIVNVQALHKCNHLLDLALVRVRTDSRDRSRQRQRQCGASKPATTEALLQPRFHELAGARRARPMLPNTATRTDSSVASIRKRDGDICLDELLSTRLDRVVVRTAFERVGNRTPTQRNTTRPNEPRG